MGNCLSAGKARSPVQRQRQRPKQRQAGRNGGPKTHSKDSGIEIEGNDNNNNNNGDEQTGFYGADDKAVPLFPSSSDPSVSEKADAAAQAKHTFSAPALGSAGQKSEHDGEEGAAGAGQANGTAGREAGADKNGGDAPATAVGLSVSAEPATGGGEAPGAAGAGAHAQAVASATLASYSYSELSAATDGFNSERKLGEGGFGSVYWGELDLEDGVLGRTGRLSPVAIKILNEDGLQGHKEWLAEVTLLGTLRHPHLVRLLGWSAEGTSRLLVYEYMPNGSLDALLHPLPGSPDSDVPPWGLRMEIALGVATCLEYLHEGRVRPIIYRDLKSANVLLDHDWKAKLADFGLAKDGPVGDKTHVTTQVVGTHGYADPDYIITGHLTPKSDVYGFGVLMLELITGRHALNDEEDERTDVSGAGYEGEEEDLAEWAMPYLDDRRRIVEILDKRIAGSVPQRGLVKAALLARQCINDSPYERPQMSSIVKTLLSIQHPYTWPPQ